VSWPAAVDFCLEKKFADVCPYEAYCPKGTDQPPVGGLKQGDSGGDQWSPIGGDGANIWVQVGEMDGDDGPNTCRTQETLEGRDYQHGRTSKEIAQEIDMEMLSLVDWDGTVMPTVGEVLPDMFDKGYMDWILCCTPARQPCSTLQLEMLQGCTESACYCYKGAPPTGELTLDFLEDCMVPESAHPDQDYSGDPVSALSVVDAACGTPPIYIDGEKLDGRRVADGWEVKPPGPPPTPKPAATTTPDNELPDGEKLADGDGKEGWTEGGDIDTGVTAWWVTPMMEVTAIDGVPGHTTYRLKVLLGGTAANCYVIYGAQWGGEPTMGVDVFLQIPPAYQAAKPFGADIGGVSPQLFSFVPDAEFDSWLTVAEADGNLQELVSTIGIDFTQWTDKDALETGNGAVFWMDPDKAPAAPGPRIGHAAVVENQPFVSGLRMQGSRGFLAGPLRESPFKIFVGNRHPNFVWTPPHTRPLWTPGSCWRS
jgi:hypothetical protein